VVVVGEVNDDDKCHAAVGRHMLKKILERGNTTGGGADADNGAVAVGCFGVKIRVRNRRLLRITHKSLLSYRYNTCDSRSVPD
jgi:hypothetical protein